MPTAVLRSQLTSTDADLNCDNHRQLHSNSNNNNTNTNSNSRKRKVPQACLLSRIVSQDFNETDELKQREQHPRLQPSISLTHSLLSAHIKALAVENMQLPLRPILAKLMTHPIHNKRGTFNQPVRLEDYTNIIAQPMDLGTIKQKLYSYLYTDISDFERDIQLVFSNAMIYNPPSHPVHVAANNLLHTFHDTAYEKTQTHTTCTACLGRTCALCLRGCMQLEPNLIICSGGPCMGKKIKRGGDYYCTPDGHKAWCKDCYSNLPAILPSDDFDTSSYNQSSHNSSRYKRNLLKRKNDEHVVEAWITCSQCLAHMHSICAFANDVLHHQKNDFVCPNCVVTPPPPPPQNHTFVDTAKGPIHTCFTFITGKEIPEQIPSHHSGTHWDAKTLQHDAVTTFMEKKVQACMLANHCPSHAEKTITVRNITQGHKYFHVPDIVQRHFRMIPTHNTGTFTDQSSPPTQVPYKSRAMALFQKFDGIDVCLFCIYVQEYDNIMEDGTEDTRQDKRVYIAYLDSVDYFRPRHSRTDVYQTMLIAYLATARARGFEYAHIWSCPPSKGNSFVFWSHPPTQKTPTRERLRAWYHETLNRALLQGIVTDIISLYEFAFQSNISGPSTPMVCPPLFDGDLWIEEACRVHANMTSRFMKKAFAQKSNKGPGSSLPMQIAHMISDQLMTESCAQPFLRPVNAAALNLVDYHDKIKRPMDLATIYCRCCLGEYDTLGHMVSDVKLVVDNAKLYNPVGHPIHNLANDLWHCFESHLNTVCAIWADQNQSAESRVSPCTTLLDSVMDFFPQETKCDDDFSKHEDKRACEANPFFEKYLGTSLKLSANPISSKQLSVVSSCKPYVGKCNDDDSGPIFHCTQGSATDSLAKRMAGDDAWLLVTRKQLLSKTANTKTNQRVVKIKSSLIHGEMCERKHANLGSDWLTHAICRTMRHMRRDFFVCRLKSKFVTATEVSKNRLFDEYISDFKGIVEDNQLARHVTSVSSVADSRFALLEFSQYRHFQFDTLRRAKYSTSMLLYYIHNPTAPGVIPKCSSCLQYIENVRWHRFKTISKSKKYTDKRYGSSCVDSNIAMQEDICSCCFANVLDFDRAGFVPIRVTLKN